MSLFRFFRLASAPVPAAAPLVTAPPMPQADAAAALRQLRERFAAAVALNPGHPRPSRQVQPDQGRAGK
jgi:hypothetical protein